MTTRATPAGSSICRPEHRGSLWPGTTGHRHEDIRYKPHIHRATEAAILAGKRPEHAAAATNRFSTLEGALACLIEDHKLSGIHARPDHPSLFHGHQS